MRSAQLTTSPSGVVGAGRDHEWLRMPSSVSAHRLSGDQRDVGTPHRVVVAAVDVRDEGIFAGVAARTVAAVVAEGDRLGERDVEAERPGDRRGHLGDLERVRQTGALVIVGEHEHLGLAGQPPERAGVQDAVAVALEAGSPRIGLLVDRRDRRRRGPGWPAAPASSSSSSSRCHAVDQLRPSPCPPTSRRGRSARRAPAVAGHRRCPALCALAHVGALT